MKFSFLEELRDLADLLYGLQCCRFLNPSVTIPKCSGVTELLWILPPAQFKQELRVNMETFRMIHYIIGSHPVFQNKSHNKQAPVEIQMAVAFERFGCTGNGASVGRIARKRGILLLSIKHKGIGDGTVFLYCQRVTSALNSLTKKYINWPML